MNSLEKLSELAILAKVNFLFEEIENLRPLTQEQESRILQKLRLDWNYHSTAIEGNSLNYGETIAFLMHGVTAKGKPLKDHLDIKGHNKAIDFIMDIIKNRDNFSEKDLRALHELILVEPYQVDAITASGEPSKKWIQLGLYKTSPNHVKTTTGEIHYYATPEETPMKMANLMAWLKENENNEAIHPIVLAALFHHKFVAIHPFDDGNGRMTRLMMNLLLMRRKYPPIVIKQEERMLYYSCLSQADSGNPIPFIEFLAENMIRSLEIYIKGAKGESLIEADDFEKEMALFKKQIEGAKEKIEWIKSDIVIKNTLNNSIIPLLQSINRKITLIGDLFNHSELYYIDDSKNKHVIPKGSMNDLSILELINQYKFRNQLNNTNESVIIFRFEDFRNEKNSFTIEYHFLIGMERASYRVSVGIIEMIGTTQSLSYNRIIENKYNKNIEEVDILQITNNISFEILNYIKKKYNNSF